MRVVYGGERKKKKNGLTVFLDGPSQAVDAADLDQLLHLIEKLGRNLLAKAGGTGSPRSHVHVPNLLRLWLRLWLRLLLLVHMRIKQPGEAVRVGGVKPTTTWRYGASGETLLLITEIAKRHVLLGLLGLLGLGRHRRRGRRRRRWLMVGGAVEGFLLGFVIGIVIWLAVDRAR